MNQIRLTDNHYVNPNSAARVEYHAGGKLGVHALFTVIFINSYISALRLQGSEAEDAFQNWNAAHERSVQDK